MKLAISNIAWDSSLREAVYTAMAETGFAGLEYAPGLLFKNEADPFAPDETTLDRVRSQLDNHGLQACSMQSLLYGCAEAALFGPGAERERLVSQIRKAIDLAARMGTTNLVFGSPRNRLIPDNMDQNTAWDEGVTAFRLLGEHAHARGVRVAVEPNPRAYGANFLTTVDEAASFVSDVDRPGISLNFDIGAVLMNGQRDQLEDLFVKHLPLISHVHLSEPDLQPAPSDIDLARRAKALCGRPDYDGWLSIEMRTPQSDPLETIRGCLTRLAEA